MNDNMFWVWINGMGAAIAITVAILVFAYWHNQGLIIAEMVKSGVNPVAVKCALQDDYGNNPVCVALAAKD